MRQSIRVQWTAKGRVKVFKFQAECLRYVVVAIATRTITLATHTFAKLTTPYRGPLITDHTPYTMAMPFTK